MDVDPTIYPALERMYEVEVRTGNTVPSHDVKEKLWQIHEQLCDAVEAAGLDVRDLSEAVSLTVSRCSEHGGTKGFANLVRSCAAARSKHRTAGVTSADGQPRPCTKQLGEEQQCSDNSGAFIPSTVISASQEKEVKLAHQRTSKPSDVVFDQQMLQLAQLSVHNAVNMCDCGACDVMFELSDSLFDDGLCSSAVKGAVGVVDGVKEACHCEGVVVELESARSAMIVFMTDKQQPTAGGK